MVAHPVEGPLKYCVECGNYAVRVYRALGMRLQVQGLKGEVAGEEAKEEARERCQRWHDDRSEGFGRCASFVAKGVKYCAECQKEHERRGVSIECGN